MIELDSMKILFDSSKDTLQNTHKYQFKGFYLSSARYIDLNIKIQSMAINGENVWRGSCDLLGVNYSVEAEIQIDEKEGMGLRVVQTNTKIQNMKYNLFGSIKNGWYTGTWVDDEGKCD